MKLMIVAVLACVALAAAAPQTRPEEPIKILKSDFNQEPDGPFQYSFETENGISQQAQGELKQVTDEDNKPQTVLVVRGSYSYPGEDGKLITINYFADESGFHAEGDSIPKPASR